MLFQGEYQIHVDFIDSMIYFSTNKKPTYEFRCMNLFQDFVFMPACYWPIIIIQFDFWCFRCSIIMIKYQNFKEKNGHTIGHINVVLVATACGNIRYKYNFQYNGERFIHCFDSHSILQALESYGWRLVLVSLSLLLGVFLDCLNTWQTWLRTFS